MSFYLCHNESLLIDGLIFGGIAIGRSSEEVDESSTQSFKLKFQKKKICYIYKGRKIN